MKNTKKTINLLEGDVPAGEINLEGNYDDLLNDKIFAIIEEISNFANKTRKDNVNKRDAIIPIFARVNKTFAYGSALNLSKFDLGDNASLDVLISYQDLNAQKDIPVSKVQPQKAPRDRDGNLLTIEGLYNELKDLSIAKNNIKIGKKSYKTSLPDSKISDLTLQQFVQLIQQVYFKEQKAAPEKSEPAPSGGGGSGTRGFQIPPNFKADKCKKVKDNLKVKSYKLKDSEIKATRQGTNAQLALTKFYAHLGQQPDYGKLNDCMFGSETTKFSIVSLKKAEEDLKEKIAELEKQIKAAKETKVQESRKLEELSKRLNLKLNYTKSNWLFEAPEQTTTSTPAQANSAKPAPTNPPVAASTIKYSDVQVFGSTKTVEEAESDLQKLKVALTKVTEAKTKLENEQNQGEITTATIQQVADALNQHVDTSGAVVKKQEKTVNVPDGGKSPAETKPPSTPPAPPPVPKTQELNCWFSFDVNVAGSPNARPIDLWNDSENSMNWESWKNLAKLVFNNEKTNLTFTFNTGPRAVYRSQVQLLIEREALSMNLGCFRTIFQQVSEVLATNLESAEKAYSSYNKPEQTAQKAAFLSSMTDFLIKDPQGNEVTYQGSNVHKLLVSLDNALDYSLQLSKGLLKSAVDRLKQTKEIGKMGAKAFVVMPLEEKVAFLKAAEEMAKRTDISADYIKALKAEIVRLKGMAPEAAARVPLPASETGSPAGQGPLGTKENPIPIAQYNNLLTKAQKIAIKDASGKEVKNAKGEQVYSYPDLKSKTYFVKETDGKLTIMAFDDKGIFKEVSPQQESLKQKREWLLHEALFRKLVKRNG